MSANSEYRAEHYKAFADALPHHAALLNHLGQAQTQVQETRVVLQETKESLGSKRADLVQLWARGQTLEEMIQLLDRMCVEFFVCMRVMNTFQRTFEICAGCPRSLDI